MIPETLSWWEDGEKHLATAVGRLVDEEFGSPVHGIEAFAAFMGRHGELKAPPQSWKDIVAPALANSPST